MLPKFLIADNSQELPNTIFVVHNEIPRFIIESDIEDFQEDQTIHWIDPKPEDETLINDLLIQAEDFLNDELDMQEELFDEDE
jgi:hypothetical protein